MNSIAENINSIREQIQGLERRHGRAAGSVTLLAVSKRHGAEKIRQAAAAGITDFGESYVQEAQAKMGELANLDCRWHFIGPIQSNKTGAIAELFHWVHSVDREKIARRLSEQRPRGSPALNVCVQVNLDAESGKSGVDPDACAALCGIVAALPGLRLRGLMAIPAPTTTIAAQRASFQRLTSLYRELSTRFAGLDTLSMGMSEDFAAAIAEGSTMIRLGTAIFGHRK